MAGNPGWIAMTDLIQLPKTVAHDARIRWASPVAAAAMSPQTGSPTVRCTWIHRSLLEPCSLQTLRPFH